MYYRRYTSTNSHNMPQYIPTSFFLSFVSSSLLSFNFSRNVFTLLSSCRFSFWRTRQLAHSSVVCPVVSFELHGSALISSPSHSCKDSVSCSSSKDFFVVESTGVDDNSLLFLWRFLSGSTRVVVLLLFGLSSASFFLWNKWKTENSIGRIILSANRRNATFANKKSKRNTFGNKRETLTSENNFTRVFISPFSYYADFQLIWSRWKRKEHVS